MGRDPEGYRQEHGTVEYENGDEGNGTISAYDRVDTPSGWTKLSCLEGKGGGHRSEGSEPKNEKSPYNVWVSEEDTPRSDEEEEGVRWESKGDDPGDRLDGDFTPAQWSN